MPTFSDKSVQGIIDVIHSSLPCFGTVTDKSVGGIKDRASSQGISISDSSIQGCIDQLSSATCVVPISTLFTFTWDFENPQLVMPTSGDQTVLMSSTAQIQGTITATTNPGVWCVMMVSIRVWNASQTSVVWQMHRPLDGSPGRNNARLYNNQWRPTGYGDCYIFDSTYYTVPYLTRDESGGYYYMMPAVYNALHVGATAALTGVNDGATYDWLPCEQKINQRLDTGVTHRVDVACGASPIPPSGQPFDGSKYVGVDLFSHGGSGITQYTKYTASVPFVWWHQGYDSCWTGLNNMWNGPMSNPNLS